MSSLIDAFYGFLDRIGYTHPIHPPLTHIPIGLGFGALAFYLASRWLRRPDLAQAARFCIILALVFLFPAAISGLLDWQHYYARAWLLPFIVKMILTCVLLVFLVLGIIFSGKPETGSRLISGCTISVYLFSFIAMVVLGYLGGELFLGGRTPPPAEAFQAGEKIYASNCGPCHPNGGNAINPSLPVVGSIQLKNFSTFSAFNRNPVRPDGSKANMPALPESRISEKQMEDLYRYILNVLQKGPEKK